MRVDIHSHGAQVHVFLDGVEVPNVASVEFEQADRFTLPRVVLVLRPDQVHFEREGPTQWSLESELAKAREGIAP